MNRTSCIRAILVALLLLVLGALGRAQDLAIIRATVYSAPDGRPRAGSRCCILKGAGPISDASTSRGESIFRILANMPEIVIRRPEVQLHRSIRDLVQTVVEDIYGHLWAPPR